MLSTWEIVQKNAATFYNFRTGRRQSLLLRYIAISATALVLCIYFGRLHDDLYTGLIAVQSIIVGFAFNLLFYLSANPIVIPDGSDFLEDESKADKLNALSEELFYNISYFNLASVFSIILSLTILLGNAFDVVRIDYPVHSINVVVTSIEHSFSGMIPVAKRAIIFATFCFTIESFATFIRIVKRLTYLFREKIILEKS